MCVTCQLIVIYNSFIQQFNLNCWIKLWNERHVLNHRKIANRIAKQLVQMIQKTIATILHYSAEEIRIWWNWFAIGDADPLIGPTQPSTRTHTHTLHTHTHTTQSHTHTHTHIFKSIYCQLYLNTREI